MTTTPVEPVALADKNIDPDKFILEGIDTEFLFQTGDQRGHHERGKSELVHDLGIVLEFGQL